jgi:hypothetical protein
MLTIIALLLLAILFVLLPVKTRLKAADMVVGSFIVLAIVGTILAVVSQ